MSKKTLLMDLRVGESLTLDGGRVVVTLQEKSGQRAKLRLVLDSDATAVRGEGAHCAVAGDRGGIHVNPSR